jgi:hypothetical protein
MEIVETVLLSFALFEIPSVETVRLIPTVKTVGYNRSRLIPMDRSIYNGKTKTVETV